MALEEANLLSECRVYSGSSMGSIIAALASVGYTGHELKRAVKKLRYEDLADVQVLGLLENYGMETGKNICALLESMIEYKTGQRELTFRQHHDLTGRELYISATCVELDECEYFSVHTEPDMPIVLALHMSIALPWLMAAVRWHGRTYIDGGIYAPCPTMNFPAEGTLALQIVNGPPAMALGDYGFMKFTADVLLGIYKRVQAQQYESVRSKYRVVVIDTGASSMSFSTSKSQRVEIIHRGYKATRESLGF